MLLRILRKMLEQFQNVVGKEQNAANWSTRKDQHTVDTMQICGTVYHLCQKHHIHGAWHNTANIPRYKLESLPWIHSFPIFRISPQTMWTWCICDAELQAFKIQSCYTLLLCAYSKTQARSIRCVAGYRHQDKGEPAVFKLDSAASAELSITCRALAMQVALRACGAADFCAAVRASECSRNNPTSCVHGSNSLRHSWEWLVGAVPEAQCFAVDVSDDTAHVLEFFGREKDDCTCSWNDVCLGLVGTAEMQELRYASEDRSELELEGRDGASLCGTSSAHHRL